MMPTKGGKWSRRYIRGDRWKRTKKQVLIRDEFKCRKCGKAGRLEVDHIIPLHLIEDKLMEDPKLAFDKTNLQALCRPCHFLKTGLENQKKPMSRQGRREIKEWALVT